MISAKFEEIGTAVPKIAELNNAVGNAYPLNDYKVLECMILKFFDWYIMFPTVAHYVSYFLRAFVNEDDFKNVNNPRSLLFEMHIVLRVLMDKVLDGKDQEEQG